MKRISLSVLFLVVYLNAMKGQQSDLPEKAEVFKNDIKNSFYAAFKEEKELLTSPFQWKDFEWATFAVFISAGGMVAGYDKELFEWVQKNKSARGDKVARYFAEPLGSGILSIPIMVGMYGIGRMSNQETMADAAMKAARAFVLTALNVQLIKVAFGRERPVSASRPYEFHGFSVHHDAFPSGHTAVAFAMAAAIAGSYPKKQWLTPCLYAAAALTGWSRINDGKHWPSDVFAGGVIGYYTGRWVAGTRDKKFIKSSGVSYFPWLSSQFAGLTISYNFR